MVIRVEQQPVPLSARFSETALYAPVRDHLATMGYTVRAEVNGCDLCATRGDDLVVVELKQRISLDLLLQAVQRQRLSDSVYVAVPAPEAIPHKRWRQLQHLLRRLELGLIIVYPQPPRAEIVAHPLPATRRKQPKARRAVLQEMAGRSHDLNTGGSNRRPLVTAYREAALKIACALEDTGPMAPAALRKLGTGPKTQTILYNNVYNWFERLDRGLYALTRRGREALAEYHELCAYLRNQLLEEIKSPR